MKTIKQKIAIAGFGIEGRAVFDYLRQQNPDAEFHIFDENLEVAPPNDLGLENLNIVFHDDLKIPAEFDIVYKTPGIPTSKLELENPETKISSLTNIFFENAKGTIIGITGTKGKGTITTLINHILKENGFDSVVLGNIGVTGLEMLKNDSQDKFYIYEMSSFQCEHLNKSPHIAILNNLYPDHLNHHNGFEEYKNAKINITKFQTKDDYFINASDFDVETKARQIKPFALDRVAIARDDDDERSSSSSTDFASQNPSLRGASPKPETLFTKCTGKQSSTKEKFETKLLGEHNQMNCLVAFEVAKILGINESKIRDAIKTYEPLPLRLEKVGEKNGVVFYDDSLATIPEAALASINALENVNTVILGGSDKGSSYENFAKELTKTLIQNFIIFPITGKEMVKYVKDDPSRKIFEANSMEEAVRFAYENTKGICLMATAAASFGLFKNYKDRSEQYKYWIEKM